MVVIQEFNAEEYFTQLYELAEKNTKSILQVIEENEEVEKSDEVFTWNILGENDEKHI